MAAEEKNIPEGWPPPPGKRHGGRGTAIGFTPPRGMIPLIIMAMLLVFVVYIFVSGKGGIVDISDTEIAVLVNYMTGEERIITTPGITIFMPWANEAFIFDKAPNEFVMRGRTDLDFNHVRELSIRASDGSSFRFDEMVIQYQLIPSAAAVVLQDSGEGDAFKRN